MRPSSRIGDADPDTESVSLAQFILFARERWLPILGCALLVGALTATLLALLPPRYKAAATLVVVPPRFSSDLKPETLSLQGYQRLLESDAVIAETGRRLAEEVGGPATVRVPRLGTDLTSRIFVSRRSDDTVLAPVLEAVAFSRTGEAAAAKANAWAAVFLETVRDVMNTSTRATIELIEAEYATARHDLEALEQRRLETGIEYQERIDDVRLAADRKLVEAKQATEDDIADHRVESRALMEALAERHGLLSGTASEEDPNQAQVAGAERGALEIRLLQLVSLRTNLAQTPSFLVLARAVSDDALWQAMALTEGRVNEIEPVWNRNLVSQEVNPVHTEVSLRLSEVELEIDQLAVGNQERVHRIASELERLQNERSAALAKLTADRALEIDRLQTEKHRNLQALMSERDVVLSRLDRDLSHHRSRFSALSAQLNEAKLASAGENLEDVRLGSRAVAPLRAEPRHALILILGATALGGVLGLVLAFLLELSARGRTELATFKPAPNR